MLTISRENAKLTDWANLPMSEMAFGCAMDCDFTNRLYDPIRNEMEDENVNPVYDKVLSDVIIEFAYLESKGIRVNQKQLSVLDVLLTKRIKALEIELNDMSPIKDIELTKPQQVMEVLFTSKGYDIDPLDWTKTQLPKMDKECLEKLIGHVHGSHSSTSMQKLGADFIEKYLLWKKTFKQHNDYVKNLKKALVFNGNGRIYCQYNFSATKTGRLSNSAYSITRRELSEKTGKPVSKKHSKGVSFHTLPRPDEEEEGVDVAVNLRQVMRCEPGNVFIYGDYSAAEVRVLAHCSGDKNLINAFNTGVDLHKYTASLVFGKDMSEITSYERTVSKSVTFLILYGGGPTKLAGQIKKPIKYCKKIFKAYFAAYPGVEKWIQDKREEILRTGYAVSLFGRRRRLLNVNSPERRYQERALRQGINFIIQSSASDLMIHAIWRLKTLSKKLNIKLDLVATVHDSLEIEAPKEAFHKAASLMKYCMSDTGYLKDLYGWTFKVPFEVDMECGDAFGSGVESKFDAKYNMLNREEALEYVKQAA